jgi:hypothetical protein
LRQRQLGLTAIPVIIFDHLTPAQKRAYLIADNRIAEQAGWDRELLAVELGELIELLPAQGLDVTLTGFEVAEIDLLIADMATSPPAPEDVLPTMPSKVVSRSGDLWQLGKHRLLCGDARKSGNFAKLMNALSAHPTVKPIALVADAILDCTARGDLVLDQFAGSGTILLAAEKTGRIAHAMEYEPRYVDVGIRRWESATKLEAALVGDGRTFEEIAASRLPPSTPPAPQSPHVDASDRRKRTNRKRGHA